MIKKICTLGAAVPKPCALGLVCGPIPLFMGTVIVPGVIRYFGESKKEKINLSYLTIFDISIYSNFNFYYIKNKYYQIQINCIIN